MKLFGLIVLTFFIATKAYSQDSLKYKLAIDSILIKDSKQSHKRISISKGKGVTLYYFNRRSKQLTNIRVIIPKESSEVLPWTLNYNFINGNLVMISRWNGFPIKNKKRRVAFYYLKDGIVIYREERGTEIQNIEASKTDGIELANSAPIYE